MPFGAGHWPYLLILLAIVLVVVGPGKLPDVGAGLGRAIREFKKTSSDAMASHPEEAQPAPVTVTATTDATQR